MVRFEGKSRRTRKDVPHDLGDEVLQIVVYIGSKTARLPKSIRYADVEFVPQFIDVRSLDAEENLQNGTAGDAILASLCGGGSSPEILHRIVSKLGDLEEKARQDAFVQLVILAGLRKTSPVVIKEIENMGLTLSVEDIPLLREPIDRALETGRAEGKIEGKVEGKLGGMADAIRTVLAWRFPEVAPGDLLEILSDLDANALDEILANSLGASSLEDALGAHFRSPMKL